MAFDDFLEIVFPSVVLLSVRIVCVRVHDNGIQRKGSLQTKSSAYIDVQQFFVFETEDAEIYKMKDRDSPEKDFLRDENTKVKLAFRSC